MIEVKTRRLLVMGTAMTGLSLSWLLAAAHGKPSPKSLPSHSGPLQLRAIAGSAVLFRTSSKAVAERLLKAMRAEPGVYRIQVFDKGNRGGREFASRGRMTVKDIALVRQMVATNIAGYEKQPNQYEELVTAPGADLSLTNSDNQVGSENTIGGGDRGVSAQQSDVSSRSGAYVPALRESLRGIDSALYQMDIVDAKLLSHGQYVRLGRVTPSGIVLTPAARDRQ